MSRRVTQPFSQLAEAARLIGKRELGHRLKTGGSQEAQELAHIFDRFYQAPGSTGREGKGTGLGLAIVKALVEAQGGEVCASSQGRNQGSEFTIYLFSTGMKT